MTSMPLYSGLTRSANDWGMGSFFASDSTVFTQNPVIQASMPTQLGVASASRYGASMRSRPLGAYGSSRPCCSSSKRLVAARPQTTSATGLSFSASSLAVTMPVESRTNFTLMSGWRSLNEAM